MSRKGHNIFKSNICSYNEMSRKGLNFFEENYQFTFINVTKGSKLLFNTHKLMKKAKTCHVSILYVLDPVT